VSKSKVDFAFKPHFKLKRQSLLALGSNFQLLLANWDLPWKVS